MAGTQYDIIIDGVKARIARDQEGAYRRRFVRQEIQQQVISQSEDPTLTSRMDYARMYQNSWVGGARWWKPIIGANEVNSYFQSNHMDVWSEPGKVVPTNAVVDAANTALHDNCVLGTDGTDIYAIGSTTNVNASFLDVYKWTPASDAFVQETGYHSGVQDDSDPVAMVYDPSDNFFYVLSQVASSGGREITRFDPVTPGEDAAWFTNAANLEYGSNIFLTQAGLTYYAGGSVFSINKSGPSHTALFSDGLGVEILPLPTGTDLFRNFQMALSTPEGVYYVKNTRQSNQPVPWIFRLDRDAAGNTIGNPIANLPAGSIALGLTHHLGDVYIAATPDWQAAIDNDTDHAEIVIYSINDGGLSALGSLLGGRDELDETPYAFVGSSGAELYIGGHKRLWVYDAIRGGLHTAWEWGTELTSGPYVSMAWVQDSDGDSAMIFLGRDRIARVKAGRVDDPDTVTAFGDDETHYTIESNYFDFNLPFELKELAKVEVLHDAIDASSDQEWTVQASADDATFADILTNSTASSTYASATLSGTSGRRFRYRLIYQTKDTNRVALRSLLVTANSGENVLEYQLILDGSELLSINNEIQDEQVFYDAMVSLAGTETQVNFVDNMQEQEQETDSATTTKVKVRSVEIIKDKPGESLIQLVVRGA